MTGGQAIARVSGSAETLLARIKALPTKTLHRLVCGLLLIWILIILLQLLWFFIASDDVGPVTDADSASVAIEPRASAAIDIDALQNMQLFGEAGARAPVAAATNSTYDEAEEVEKTRLNLKLEGIVYTSDGEGAIAVIVYQGKQDQYLVGDPLPVGNRVSLARVLIDHVILDNAGDYESLWLYDEEKNASSTPIRRVNPPPQPSRTVTDKRQDSNATALAKGYRERLYKNPKSLAEVLRISPHSPNGQLAGYRVSPGSDREQFTALGFKTNDVVTSINGIELNEPSRALEIYKLMRTATEASFSVDRNGQSIEVLVSLEEG